MSSDFIPSLGDRRGPKYRIQQLEQELPGTRREIANAVFNILEQGGVQKIVVEHGRPIRYDRMVKADPLDEAPPVELNDDLYQSARNAEMVELAQPALALQALFFAFHQVSLRRLKPKAIFANNLESVRKWLGFNSDSQLEEVYGVEIRKVTELPEDMVLLVAAPAGSPTGLASFSIRIPMYFPRKESKK